MKIENIEVPFAQIPNDVLYDEKLSWKAKGIFAYIQAKPNDWDFSSARMSNEKDGVDSTRSGLIELEEAGYLVRQKQQDGRVKFKLCVDKKPEQDIPFVGKSLQGKSPRITKKEIHTKKDKEINTDAPDEQVQKDIKLPKKQKEKKEVVYKTSHQEISAVIHAMVAVDAKNKLYYSNSTQKGACDFLVQEYGYGAVLDVVAGIPQARVTVPFFPSVTTPCELRDKWVKIHEAVHRMNKSKKPDKEMV